MKKAFLKILLLMTLSLSLTACGGKEAKEPDKTQEKDTSKEEDKDEAKKDEDAEAKDKAEEEDSDKDSAGEEAEGDVSPIHIILKKYSDSASRKSDYRRIAEGITTVSYLSEEDARRYPELDKTLRQKGAERKDEHDTGFRSMINDYLDMWEYNADYMDEMYFYDNDDAHVIRADSNAVSLLYTWDSYWGGAHGAYGTFGYNYDPKTGKELRLEDVVLDQDAFFEIVDHKLQTEYSDIYEELEKLDTWRAFLKENDDLDPTWSIDQQGVNIYFNSYELIYYAGGAQYIKVYFDEAPEIFAKQYRTAPEDYVTAFLPYENPIRIDVDGDGETELLTIDTQYKANDYQSYTINCGNRAFTIDHDAYSQESYLVSRHGKYYMYLFEAADSDDYILNVVDLEKMDYAASIEDTGWIFLGTTDYDSSDRDDGDVSIYSYWDESEAFTDPDNFMAFSHLEILGTHYGYRNYRVDKKTGIPLPRESAMIVRGTSILRTKRDLECDIVTRDGEIIKKDYNIPEGSLLLYVRSDGETWAELQDIEDPDTVEIDDDPGSDWVFFSAREPLSYNEDAPIYRIHLEQVGDYYLKQIKGQAEEYWFDGVYYAG